MTRSIAQQIAEDLAKMLTTQHNISSHDAQHLLEILVGIARSEGRAEVYQDSLNFKKDFEEEVLGEVI